MWKERKKEGLSSLLQVAKEMMMMMMMIISGINTKECRKCGAGDKARIKQLMR